MFQATHCSSSGAQTVFAASGFTYVCGCWPLSAAGNHRHMMSNVSLKTLSNKKGIINSNTWSHLVGYF